MDRYEGKPFLKLLDCYVLSAIGQLDEHNQQALRSMEPKLCSVYNVDGTWLDIVRSQMDFPETFPDQILDIWAKNLAKAHESRTPINPNEFAIAFVNQNFPNILG